MSIYSHNMNGLGGPVSKEPVTNNPMTPASGSLKFNVKRPEVHDGPEEEEGDHGYPLGRFHHRNVTDDWRNLDAAHYADKLAVVYGPADMADGDTVTWKPAIGRFHRVWIMDEKVAHDFPVSHTDYLYSSFRLEVPEKMVGVLAGVSESIMVDRLKGTVTVRCASLLKNAITAQLVIDVVGGKVSKFKAKPEYASRIRANVAPEWFKDPLAERKA